MTLLSLSKMITAELRGTLDSFCEAEASSMPSIEAFDAIAPLPMWLELRDGGLCYHCPISRVLAAKYHLDMKFLAGRWREIIWAARGKECLAVPRLGRGQFFEERDGLDAVPFSFEADTQMYQDDALLVWRLDRLGGLRWLAMATAEMAQSLVWEGVGPDTSYLEGLLLSGRQCTVEREFDWHYSYASSFGLSQRIQALSQEAVDGLETPSLLYEPVGLNPSSREGSGDSSQLAWVDVWPLLLAQMSLLDAIAISPQRWVPAVDRLSEAWATWLSTQVLNDLRLRQMAYVVPVRNLACLTQALLGLAIRVGFGTEPICKL